MVGGIATVDALCDCFSNMEKHRLAKNVTLGWHMVTIETHSVRATINVKRLPEYFSLSAA